MEGPLIPPLTKLETFKKLYKTIIDNSPTVVTQGSKSAWKYTPPSMPRPEASKPVELVFDSSIPACLINGLDRFADSLEEDRLDGVTLHETQMYVKALRFLPRTFTIQSKTSVLSAFGSIVVVPVRGLCRSLGVHAEYQDAPRVVNVNLDHSWTVKKKPVIIFEHKNPTAFDGHYEEILSMARQRATLNLRKASNNGKSILAKLILASLVEKFEYCVLHCTMSFIVLRLVQNPQNGRYQARISDVIPLTSSTTPIIPLVLALILHSTRDGSALEYQSSGSDVATNTEVHYEEDEDLGSSSPGPEPHNPTDQQGDPSSSNDSAGFQVHAPCTLPASEYWEPEEISEAALAALLKTTDGISLYWDLHPFSREVFRPIRRDDSSLWAQDPPIKPAVRLTIHSPAHHDVTPPPPPPVVPFVFELKSMIGGGAVGSVYRGQFLGLSIPLVAKVLPTEKMEHELEMWRKLRALAGIYVPGLFGAYSLEGQEGCEDTGALVQQYAGRTLSSFDILDHKQRRVIGIEFTAAEAMWTYIHAVRCDLYRTVTRIHEANVEHGGLSPRNVALDDGGRVMVLDFSHSSHHECEGEGVCEELESLRRKLLSLYLVHNFA
ncbi:hypothetical protein FRC01_008494 [Tulasnella sp. 417]|nr:hypothetical protein FRC01_008494 [Tulasnella sp. 417]